MSDDASSRRRAAPLSGSGGRPECGNEIRRIMTEWFKSDGIHILFVFAWMGACSVLFFWMMSVPLVLFYLWAKWFVFFFVMVAGVNFLPALNKLARDRKTEGLDEVEEQGFSRHREKEPNPTHLKQMERSCEAA